jgi:DNA-directed RNA polymerase subunit RPC12/RpoP
MAIKFSCGSCGKKFTTRNDHAGRRSKCPSCGWGIVVPMPATREPHDSPALVPSPIQVVSARASTIETNSEPEAQKPKKSGNQGIGKWIIAVAALGGSIALALMALGVYTKFRTGSQPAASSLARNSVAVAPEPVTPTPKPVTRFDLAVIEQIAQIYPARTARIVFGTGNDVNDVKILKSNVRRAEPDRRKIDWLWEGDVSFTIIQGDGDAIPVRMTMLYHLSPDGEEWECWRDVTMVRYGLTRHNRMAGSEWNRAFRQMIASESKRSFDLYQDATSPQRRSEIRQGNKEWIAQKHGITVVELEEILETPN